MVEQQSQTISRTIVLAGIVVAGIVLSAFAGSMNPLVIVGVPLVAGALVASLLYPDMATILVAFLIYTNAAVVAVQFHGVPYLIGAGVMAALIVPFAAHVVIQRHRIVITPVFVLLLLFIGIQFIGVMVAVRVPEAIDIVNTSITEGLLLYFLVTNVIRRFEVLRGVIWALVIAGGLLGGLTFYQNITGTYDNNYGGFAQVSNAAFRISEDDALFREEQPRLEGPIGEQNRYAQTLLMLVPLGLMLFSTERQPLLRLLALVAVGLTSIGMALTFSRGAAVGFGLTVLIMTAVGYIKVRYVAGIAIGVLLLFQAVPDYGTRLSSLMELTAVTESESGGSIADADTSTQSRVTEMLAAGLMFADHPIIGVGPGMYRYYYREYGARVGIRVLSADRYAHSLFPGLAAEHGALGMAAFLGILGVSLLGLARMRRQTLKTNPARAQLATAFVMVITLYLTTGIFLHFGYIRFFWLMIALANVVVALHKNEVAAGNRTPAALSAADSKVTAAMV